MSESPGLLRVAAAQAATHRFALAEAARQWSVAREVENALCYAARPRHEGDLARSLWVASTLAGRTLPDLPAPHELPAPGQAFS